MVRRVPLGLAQLFQYHMGRTVPQLAARHMAVIDGHDGAVGAFLCNLVDDHLAVGTELLGHSLGDLLERLHFLFFQHGYPSIGTRLRLYLFLYGSIIP